MTRGNRLTNEELEEIRERAEKATEGPWEYIEYTGDKYEMPKFVSSEYPIMDFGDCTTYYPIEGSPPDDGDATFIAHAREDIPKLLAEIESLRKSVEYCKQLTGGLTRENAILKGEKPITVHLNGGDDE